MWHGKILAHWDYDYEEGESPQLPDTTIGYDGSRPTDDDGRQTLTIGHLERWLLPLGDKPVCHGRMPPIDSPFALFEAGDAISQSLADITGSLHGSTEWLFSDAVYSATGVNPERGEGLRGTDRALRTELAPQARGWGIGAWASATSICALPRPYRTLLAAKAAPLRRGDFMDGDHETNREMTPQESKAWQTASDAISRHWQRALGLVSLEGADKILVGVGDFYDEDALLAQACRWRADGV